MKLFYTKELNSTNIFFFLQVSISNTYPISFGLIDVHLKKRVEGDSGKVAEFKSKVAASLSRRMKVTANVYY